MLKPQPVINIRKPEKKQIFIRREKNRCLSLTDKAYRLISKLETISCVFLPLREVLKRAAGNNFANLLTPLKGVLKRVPFIVAWVHKVSMSDFC